MTNIFSKISIGVIVLATFGGALANDNNLQTTSSYAKQGFIIGADIGEGITLAPSIIYGPGIHGKEVSLPSQSKLLYSSAYGVHVGYNFKITPDLLIGLESGFKSFNLGNLSEGIYRQDAFDLLLTTHCYLYKGFNVFGKAGTAIMMPDIYYYTNEYKIKPEFVLGVGYTFLNNIDTHVAFISTLGANDSKKRGFYNGDLLKSTVYASRAVMFGVSYTF
jgi:hypothetical protein